VDKETLAAALVKVGGLHRYGWDEHAEAILAALGGQPGQDAFADPLAAARADSEYLAGAEADRLRPVVDAALRWSCSMDEADTEALLAAIEAYEAAREEGARP